MNSKLEKILMQEASNTNRIYLHYRPQHEHWVAYEQSALNLLSLAPLLLPDEEIFAMLLLALSKWIVITYQPTVHCWETI